MPHRTKPDEGGAGGAPKEIPGAIEEAIERVLAAHPGLDPETLEEMRARLRVYAETHPTMRRRVAALVEREPPDRSGTVPTEAAEGASPPVATPRRAGKTGR